MSDFPFRAVRDFSDVLGATFGFIRQNLKHFARVMLVCVLPVTVLETVAQGLFSASMLLEASGEAVLGIGSYYVTIILARVVASVAAAGYLILFMRRGGPSFDSWEIWRFIRRYWLRILGLTGLTGIILILSTFLFILPAIFMAVPLTLAAFILLYEDLGIFASISRSMELIRDKWLQTFSVLLIGFFIYGCLAYMLIVPSTVLNYFYLSLSTSGDGSSLWLQILNSALYFGASLSSEMLYCIPATVIAMQYFNLVERREFIGLIERLERLRFPSGKGGSGTRIGRHPEADQPAPEGI